MASTWDRIDGWQRPWGWFGRAPLDPEALNTPVYLPVARAPVVTVHLWQAEGLRWHLPSVGRAVTALDRLLPGRVELVLGCDVPLHADAEGMISRTQVREALETLPSEHPAHIPMLLVPPMRDLAYSFCCWRSDDRYAIAIQTRRRARRGWGRVCRWLWLPLRPMLRREAAARHILHELCHTLKLPSRREHCAPLEHCTHPSCALYPASDLRWWLWVLLRMPTGPTLCRACRAELAAALAESEAKPITPANGVPDHDAQQPAAATAPALADDGTLGWHTRRIELNPSDARPWAYRGDWRRLRGDPDGAIADLTAAIDLDPDNARWLAHRGTMFCMTRRFPQGIADLRRAVELDPGDERAARNLNAALSRCQDQTSPKG